MTTKPRAGQGTFSPERFGLGSCYLSTEGPRGLRRLRLPGKGLAVPAAPLPRVPSSPPGLREQIGISAGGRGWWLELRASWVGRGGWQCRHGSGVACFPSAGSGRGGGCGAMPTPSVHTSRVGRIRCHRCCVTPREIWGWGAGPEDRVGWGLSQRLWDGVGSPLGATATHGATGRCPLPSGRVGGL